VTAALRPAIDRAAIGIADRLRLYRDRGGRPAFPFVGTRRGPCFQILSYHRVNDARQRFFPGVPVERFRRQMEALARVATVLPLGELAARMETGDVPPRSVAVTFDDGYRDNYEHAFPVLRRLGLPATIFLTTGPLDTGAPLWHDRVFDAFERAGDGCVTMAGQELPMAPLPTRRRTLRSVLAHLRSLDRDARERAVRDLEQQVGEGTCRDGGSRMLSWEQVVEMAGAGIEFGAHTVSHPILTRIPPAEAAEEIRLSRASIESRLGRRVDAFAYPNGTREDFDAGIQAMLREQGFRCAVTTLWGVNDADSPPFELRRIGFWNTDPGLLPLRLAWYRFGG
jgi:peptidoglycan/xylan/chitin deacetylase (PgdA/CDA1 family)